MTIKYVIFSILCLTLFSCGRNKAVFIASYPVKTTEELVQKLDELSNLEWDFLTAKTNVSITNNDQTNTFKASLRMKRDSALLVNISFAGIPIVQSVLSNDSLKLLNRKDKCFKFQDRSALEKLIDFPIQYSQLQDLLIGKPLLFDKSKEHIQIVGNDHYEIKTKRQRSPNTSNKDILISYFLSTTTLDLKKVELESPEDNMSMEITYTGKHEKIEGLMIPEKIDIVISTPKSKILVNISYNRPDVSNEKKIALNVPENYVSCP